MSDPNTATTATTVTIGKDSVKLPASLQHVEQLIINANDIGADGTAHLLETLHGLGPLNLNFDPGHDIPTGYDMLVMPVSTRVENPDVKERKTKPRVSVVTDVAVCLIPQMSALEATDNGKEFLRRAVVDACAVKIRTAYARARDKASNKIEEGKLDLPRSLEDFISKRERGDSELTVWKHYASALVETLKKAGLKNINADILKLCLQSKSFAEATFPRVDQVKVWEKLLNRAAETATKDGKSPDVFNNWLKTRNEIVGGDEEVAELADL